MPHINEKNKLLKAGVIGWPVEHSISPIIHQYWLNQFNINGSYEKIALPLEDFKQGIFDLKAQGWQGVNITIPYKVEAFHIADVCDEHAKKCKAANTLYFNHHHIAATNSDGYGFISYLDWVLLKQKRVMPTRPKIMILGAGGAARGIVGSLLEAYPNMRLFIINRDQQKAKIFYNDMVQFFVDPQQISLHGWDGMHGILADIDLLVNTTSLGMINQPTFPDLALSMQQLHVKTIVYDIVYKPIKTEFLRFANMRGNLIIDGLGMLVHQAMPGFIRWFSPLENPTFDDALAMKLSQYLKS